MSKIRTFFSSVLHVSHLLFGKKKANYSLCTQRLVVQKAIKVKPGLKSKRELNLAGLKPSYQVK